MQIPKYFYFRIKTDRKGLTVEVEDASDVDVAEVVRCRECKHNYGINEPMCDFADRKLRETDFCSRGERKGGDE